MDFSLNIFRKYQKTVAMSAMSFLGESPLFLIDYGMRLLRVALLLSVWRSILAGKGVVAGLSMSMVLTYTLIGEVFGDQLNCRTEVSDTFWDGSITTRYLRPLSIFGQFMGEMWGKWLPGIVLVSVPLLLFAPILGVNPLPATPLAAGIFVISLALAVSVGMALDFIFTAVAVRYGLQPFAVERIRMTVSSLLSGAIVPLALLPWGIGNALEWLPFASLASAPLQIYIGAGNALPKIGIQIFWSLVLWPVAIWAWRINREKMVSYGG